MSMTDGEQAILSKLAEAASAQALTNKDVVHTIGRVSDGQERIAKSLERLNLHLEQSDVGRKAAVEDIKRHVTDTVSDQLTQAITAMETREARESRWWKRATWIVGSGFALLQMVQGFFTLKGGTP